MLDVSFSELLLILVVAFVAIGPKELPVVIRHVSKYLREFRAFRASMRMQMHDVAKAAGLEELYAPHTILDMHGNPQPAYDVGELEALGVASRQSSVVSEERGQRSEVSEPVQGNLRSRSLLAGEPNPPSDVVGGSLREGKSLALNYPPHQTHAAPQVPPHGVRAVASAPSQFPLPREGGATEFAAANVHSPTASAPASAPSHQGESQTPNDSRLTTHD